MAVDPKRAMLDGKNKILLFRELANQNTEAAKLSFQTSHTFEFTRDAEAVVTKDGTIRRLSELESSVTGIEAIQAKDDPVAKMLLNAVIEGNKLELWEVTVDEDLKNEEGKYPAVYCQGYLTSWSTDNGVDDPTASGDFAIELVPQFGFTPLTEEQEEAVQYAFKETLPDGEGGGVEG